VFVWVAMFLCVFLWLAVLVLLVLTWFRSLLARAREYPLILSMSSFGLECKIIIEENHRKKLCG